MTKLNRQIVEVPTTKEAEARQQRKARIHDVPHKAFRSPLHRPHLMKRIFLFVICLAFSTSSLLAEDWLSIFHGYTALDVTERLTTEEEYVVVLQRLATEDSDSAQKEITELAAVYDQHPGLRLLMDFFLHDVAYGRLAAFGGTTDAFLRPLQPIVPILFAHLFDSDEKATQATMGVLPICKLRQSALCSP